MAGQPSTSRRAAASLERLAAQFGSPVYVYELSDVRRAFADLMADLPAPSLLYYSLKANPHPDLVRQLRLLGCRAEVSSPGELATATAAGFDPSCCLYTGPAKRPADVASAVGAGVGTFSVDSAAELQRLGESARSAGRTVDCLLRINADEAVGGMGLSMTGRSSQFGVDLGHVLHRPQDYTGSGAVRVVGAHLYMGSNIVDEVVLRQTFEVGIDAARRLRDEAGVRIEVLDLGGGFGSPYARAADRPRFPGLRAALEPLLDAAFPRWRAGDPQLAFESGRYLVGGCGVLGATVLDVKQSKGQTYVVLDAGINCLGGLAGLRRLPRVRPDFGRVQDRALRTVDVVGPLCTPTDFLSRGVEMPEPRAGDLLTIPNVGAYGLTASLVAFLGHPLPAEVTTDEGRVVSATRPALIRTTASAITATAAEDEDR